MKYRITVEVPIKYVWIAPDAPSARAFVVGWLAGVGSKAPHEQARVVVGFVKTHGSYLGNELTVEQLGNVGN